MTTPEQPANTPPSQPPAKNDKWQPRLEYWSAVANDHQKKIDMLRGSAAICFLIGTAGLITWGISQSENPKDKYIFEIGGGIATAFVVPGAMHLRSLRRERESVTNALNRVRALEDHQIQMDQAAAYNLNQVTNDPGLAARVGNYLIESGELQQLTDPVAGAATGESASAPTVAQPPIPPAGTSGQPPIAPEA